MNLDKIRTYAEHYKGGIKKLASDIAMSEGNLHRCIRTNKIQASDLERIAMKLKVNVGVFFDESVTGVDDNGNPNEVVLLQERIKHLEERLADKDEMINILKLKIQ